MLLTTTKLDILEEELFRIDELSKTSINKARIHVHASECILQLLNTLNELEEFLGRDKLHELAKPIQEIFEKSPFFKHGQNWPHGYQGDFEIIDYIMHYKTPRDLKGVGYYIELSVLNSPITQQHRNKVKAQSKLIQSCIEQNGKSNILSIGCGPSDDIYNCKELIAHSKSKVDLVDMDKNALSFAKKKLEGFQNNCNFVNGNIYKIAKTLKKEYDLILIGGVFDYVKDKFIVNLLETLYTKNLKHNGRLFFTNIDAHNPYRVLMEYCMNWYLIERDPVTLMNLCKEAQIQPHCIQITQEKTGLTNLVQIKK